VALLIILIVLFYFMRFSLASHQILLTAALMVTLLVSPYLYNYDFLLLLVPFAVLANKSNLIQKVILVICYLAPTLALLFLGRAGNISLILVAILLTALLYLRMLRALRAKNSVIDFTAPAA
jgi:hypothetical protein